MLILKMNYNSKCYNSVFFKLTFTFFFKLRLIRLLFTRRRCNSVLLNQIKEELVSDYRINNDHIISINFEDVKFSKIKNSLIFLNLG